MRYAGRTFKMKGTDGPVEVRQVSVRSARKAYGQGKDVYLLPCNVAMGSNWYVPSRINRKTTNTKLGNDAAFEVHVNIFRYYECNRETGRYPIFFAPV